MRKLLLVSVAAMSLVGCTAAQIESGAATIESDIQAGVAATCGIVPTVGTILAVVGAITGTTEITTIANAAIAAVEADICSAAPAAASARLRSLPLRSSVPVSIGTSRHGVPVYGWRS